MSERARNALMLLALVAAACAAFFLLFEKSDREVEHPPIVEARRNPHLALVRLMEARGMQVTSAQALTSPLLAGQRAVVWMTKERLDLGTRNDAVADWLRAGGRLVVSVGPEGGPLIDALRQDFDPESGFAPAQLLGPYPHDDEDTLDGREIPLLTGWALACETGDILAAVGPYGAGTLGLLADPWRFDSENALTRESVELYWDTLRLAGIGGDVLFVYGESTTGWATLLWRHGKPLLLSSLVLLLTWLVHVSRRFGPLLPARDRERRSLMEHVAATGSLLWRQGARDLLLDAVRDGVRHRIAVSRADWSLLGDAELAPHLAALSELSTPDVLAALSDPAPPNPTAFARQITHLQQLRAALGGSA